MTNTAHAAGELVDSRGRKYLTADERTRFLGAVRSHPKPSTRTLALTLTMTGCRVSEALGLRACDVDLDAAELRIEDAHDLVSAARREWNARLTDPNGAGHAPRLPRRRTPAHTTRRSVGQSRPETETQRWPRTSSSKISTFGIRKAARAPRSRPATTPTPGPAPGASGTTAPSRARPRSNIGSIKIRGVKIADIDGRTSKRRLGFQTEDGFAV